MGTWDTGIFDNDSAADFSGSVEHASDVPARHDLLMATMGAVLEREIREDEVAKDYSMGYELSFALAAAAYVADAKNGVHQFTDNAYAMGHNQAVEDPDDDGHWYHIDLGTPGPELVQRGVLVVAKILARMVAVGLEDEWQEPVRELLVALNK
jgi:hypothetical protein